MIEQWKFRSDVPGYRSIGIGDQLSATQNRLFGFHDLFIIFNIAGDHVAGEEIVVGLADQFLL